jgi:large subunit ribosomal protein L22
MESQAYIKNVPSSPKKMRLLAADVRRLSPVAALDVLMYTPKKSARLLRNALLSAISNAKSTLRTSEDLLQFKALIIEEGIKLRRFRAGSKGMAKPYRRKLSHIKIVLTARTPKSASSKSLVQSAPKVENGVEEAVVVKEEKKTSKTVVKAVKDAKKPAVAKTVKKDK